VRIVAYEVVLLPFRELVSLHDSIISLPVAFYERWSSSLLRQKNMRRCNLNLGCLPFFMDF
jgi:hypothetical protein